MTLFLKSKLKDLYIVLVDDKGKYTPYELREGFFINYYAQIESPMNSFEEAWGFINKYDCGDCYESSSLV